MADTSPLPLALRETLPAAAMESAIHIHETCLRSLTAKFKGYESATEGDSFIIAFHSVDAAVNFCLEAQESLLDQPWPEALLHSPECKEVWAAPKCSPRTGPPDPRPPTPELVATELGRGEVPQCPSPLGTPKDLCMATSSSPSHTLRRQAVPSPAELDLPCNIADPPSPGKDLPEGAAPPPHAHHGPASRDVATPVLPDLSSDEPHFQALSGGAGTYWEALSAAWEHKPLGSRNSSGHCLSGLDSLVQVRKLSTFGRPRSSSFAIRPVLSIFSMLGRGLSSRSVSAGGSGGGGSPAISQLKAGQSANVLVVMAKKNDGPTLIFRGPRVRMGMHCGVQISQIR